jgi:hypothetical protein
MSNLMGVLSKLYRAQEHLETLEAEIALFQRRKPYEVAGDIDSEPGFFLLRFHLTEEPRQRWATIIGDVAHNYRSALDHLAWVLVKRNGGNAGRQTKFPIYNSEANYLAWREPRGANDPRGRRDDPFAGVDERVIEIIERFQPYKREDEAEADPLAILNRISNRDKHRLPVPLFGGIERGSPMSTWASSACLSEPELLNGWSAAGDWLNDGEPVARYRYTKMAPPNDKPVANVEEHLALDIVLPEAGGAVLDSLEDIAHVVRREVLPALRNFV